LAIGQIDPKGARTMVPVMKVVQIKRGLLVNLADPGTGRELPFVPAQGDAYVLLNDSGIWQAGVRGWAEMERSPLVSPNAAKTRAELIQEITSLVMENNSSPIRSLRTTFEIGAVNPRLLPAVQKVRGI